MTTYIIRRVLWGLVVIILVTIFVFLLMRLLPGDPLYLFLEENEVMYMTDEQLDEMRHQYGLDKTLIQQYVGWICDTLRGDLGYSIYNQKKLTTLLAARFPVSFELSIISWILGHGVGLIVGIIAALRRGTKVDSAVMGGIYLSITIPSFWFAIILIYILGFKFNLLPLTGWTSPAEDVGMHIKQLIMPVLCLGHHGMASTARLMRSSMLEVIQQDYVRTAWSKGLRERVIVTRHILKNSFIPIITMFGLGLAHIFGGSFIIETIFSIPGVGQLMVEGLYAHDYAIVQFSALLSAVMMVVSNVFVDISYGYFDPRIRYQ